jgi:sn-glycerol 3-phosphate transport system permease protein
VKKTNNMVVPWLLLLPATVLLAAFTHIPAVMTFINSFYRTPRGNRPARFVGMDHYSGMLSDPVFMAALKNNAIYALGTVPAAIALSMLPADGAADDCSRQHLAVLLHARLRPHRPVPRPVRLP